MDKKKLIIISASPKTRKFAREIGADLHLIKGSQREGRINEEDIKKKKKNTLLKNVLKNDKKVNTLYIV